MPTVLFEGRNHLVLLLPISCQMRTGFVAVAVAADLEPGLIPSGVLLSHQVNELVQFIEA